MSTATIKGTGTKNAFPDLDLKNKNEPSVSFNFLTVCNILTENN